MVTNNFTPVIEVTLIDVMLVKGFLYIVIIYVMLIWLVRVSERCFSTKHFQAGYSYLPFLCPILKNIQIRMDA